MTPGEESCVLHEWRQAWKSQNDKARWRNASAGALGEDVDGSTDSMQTFTGVCEAQLRKMTDVEQFPLCLKHMFPSKEIALIRIAEEANLFGIRIQIRRSDHFQLHVYGSGDDLFHVRSCALLQLFLPVDS
jgi:hypothetical protein